MKRHDRDRAEARARLQDLLGAVPEPGPPSSDPAPGHRASEPCASRTGPGRSEVPEPEPPRGIRAMSLDPEPVESPSAEGTPTDAVPVLAPPGGDAAPRAEGYEFLVLLERGPGFSRWFARRLGEDADTARDASKPAAAGPRRARRRRDAGASDPLAPAGAAAECMVVLVTGAGWDSPGAPDPLAEVHHAHVLRVRDVAAVPPDGTLAATDLPEGGSLAELLAARGRLGRGEAGRVVAQVGAGLAALRAATSTELPLEPETVCFARDGRALLVPPVGPLRALVPGSSGADEDPDRSPAGDLVAGTDADQERDPDAEDVRSLCRLTWLLLTGREPGPAPERIPLPLLCPGLPRSVVLAVEAGLEEDPAARPPMAEVLQILRGGLGDAPVDLHDSVRPEFAGRLPARVEAPREESDTVRSRGAAEDGGSAGGRERSGRRVRPREHSVVPGRPRIPVGAVPRRVRLQDWAARHRRVLVLGAAAVLLSAGAVGVLRPGGLAEAADAASGNPSTASDGTGSEGEAVAREDTTPAAASADRAAGTPSPAGELDADGARRAFQTLLTARDRALNARDAAQIGTYAVPGGDLAGKDAALVATAAQETGATPGSADSGWSEIASTASGATVLSQTADRVRIRATVHVSGYSARAGENARPDGAGGSDQTVEAELVRSGNGWKAESVRAVAS